MADKFVTLDNISINGKPINFVGKKVLLRVDLNVPIQDGKITSLERITRSTTTIKELCAKGAKVIVLSHLGRPKGDGYEAEFSLRPVAKALAEALGGKVAFAEDCIGEVASLAISSLKNGDILMLENVRFHKAETKNEFTFTKQLAELGDIFVSDAFSASHRAHSSTEGLAHVLPYAAGRLMEAELDALNKALENPQKPVLAIIGGAKISTKLDVFHNLIKKVQFIIIGGGMANTFLAAVGINVRESLCEHDMKDECLKIIAASKESSCQLVLPVDACIAKELKPNTETMMIANTYLPEDYMFFDAGEKSLENFIEIVQSVKTVLWNGPLGVFEVPPFERSTFGLAREVARLTKLGKILSVAGGGDTVSALQNAGVYDDFTYISTAGGAFLEWIEGKKLPGVVVLLKK